MIFLDCGNIDRMPVDWLRDGKRILNVDHHHDNTRFARVNLVDVERVVHRRDRLRDLPRLGVDITAVDRHRPSTSGLITDTGMFMYENTDARTHRVAAELIEAGVDVNGIFRRLYERVPEEKLRLIARALGGSTAGSTARSRPPTSSADDYAATGADETLTEGIIDFVRGIEGTAVAAVVRDKPESQREARKVSLRSTDGSVDVSRIARKMGGGGHRRAAGSRPTRATRSSSSSSPTRPAPGLAEPAARRSPSRASSCADKPAGVTSHDVVARYRRELGAEDRPRRDARSVRDRPADHPARPRDPAAAIRARPAEDLRRHRPARLAIDHRRQRRRADRDGPRPRAPRAADRDDHPDACR